MIRLSIHLYPHSPNHNGLLVKSYKQSVTVCYWGKYLFTQVFTKGNLEIYFKKY